MRHAAEEDEDIRRDNESQGAIPRLGVGEEIFSGGGTERDLSHAGIGGDDAVQVYVGQKAEGQVVHFV